MAKAKRSANAVKTVKAKFLAAIETWSGEVKILSRSLDTSIFNLSDLLSTVVEFLKTSHPDTATKIKDNMLDVEMKLDWLQEAVKKVPEIRLTLEKKES